MAEMDSFIYMKYFIKHTLSLSFNHLLPFIKEFNENVPTHILFEEYRAFRDTLNDMVYLPHRMPNHDYTYENRNQYLKISLEKRYFTTQELAMCKVSPRMAHFIVGSTLMYANYMPNEYASFMLYSCMFENMAHILIFLLECAKPPLASLQCIALHGALQIYDNYDEKIQKCIDKITNQKFIEPYFQTKEIYVHDRSIYEKNYTAPINDVFLLYQEKSTYNSFLYNYLGYMNLMYYCIEIRIKSNEIKFRKIKSYPVIVPDGLKSWVYDLFLKQISKFMRCGGQKILAQFSLAHAMNILYLKGKPYHTYRLLIQFLKDIKVTNMNAPQYYATINTLKNKLELSHIGFTH